jgi:hypothetical protein
MSSRIRALLFVFALIGALVAPMWVPLLFSAALAVRFRAWEIIGIGLLVDMLYLAPGTIYGIPFPATIFAVLLLAALEPVRRQLLNP